MKLVVFSLLLLLLTQHTDAHRGGTRVINKLERNFAKLMLDPNDVAHMKISFDKPLAPQRGLKIRSPLDQLTRAFMKKVRQSKPIPKRTRARNVQVFKFKHPVSRLLKASKRRSKARKQTKKSYKRKLNDSGQSNWFKGSIKNAAKALDIRSTTDALLAGAGTAALIYGVHAKHKTIRHRDQATLTLQRVYLFKKSYGEQLGIEVKSLGQLAEGLEDCNRKIGTTGEAIANSIDNTMMGADLDMGY